MAESARKPKLKAADKKLFTKPKALKLWSEMRASGMTLKRWCWVNRVLMGVLIRSMIKGHPEIWEADKDKVGEYFVRSCKGCTLTFYPNTKKSLYCSDPCANMFYPSKNAKGRRKPEDVASGDGKEDSTG